MTRDHYVFLFGRDANGRLTLSLFQTQEFFRVEPSNLKNPKFFRRAETDEEFWKFVQKAKEQFPSLTDQRRSKVACYKDQIFDSEQNKVIRVEDLGPDFREAVRKFLGIHKLYKLASPKKKEKEMDIVFAKEKLDIIPGMTHILFGMTIAGKSILRVGIMAEHFDGKFEIQNPLENSSDFIEEVVGETIEQFKIYLPSSLEKIKFVPNWRLAGKEMVPTQCSTCELSMNFVDEFINKFKKVFATQPVMA